MSFEISATREWHAEAVVYEAETELGRSKPAMITFLYGNWGA